MYTEREKVRYVEAMWAEGLTPCAAQRKWGRPTRASLRKWELLAEAGGLPAERPRNHGAAEHSKHRVYPEATRAEAVRLYRSGEKPAHIARRLGLSSPQIVRAWDRKARRCATMSETGAEAAPPGAGGAGEEGAGMAKKQGAGAPAEDAAALRAELDEALLQVAVYKELMRDPKADGPASLSKRRLVGLGERLRRESGCSLARISTFLGISKSTYHYHRRRIAEGAGEPDAELDGAVAGAFAASGAIYGYRRIKAQLEAEGVRAPERKVRESMARQGLAARSSRSERKWSSYAGELSDAPENLLLDEHKRHRFSAGAPDEVWLTDITEMKGRDGKAYLSVIVDCFDGRVAAWRASTSPDAELANSTLLDAVARLRPGRRPIVHSDRGGHYRWPGWVRICEEAGLVRSMSRKGHSPDNAACEGFFGRAKVELFHSLVRSGATVAELLEAVERYMEWYNGGRLKTFKEDGRKVSCETIDGRRRRLGLAA